jgi:hypothetical protein
MVNVHHLDFNHLMRLIPLVLPWDTFQGPLRRPGAFDVKPSGSLLLSLALTLVAFGTAPVSVAATPPLSKVVTLEGHGGATITAPQWKTARSDGKVTILERTGTATRGGFNTLILAVEEGPSKAQAVDWKVVRDNILDAAKGAGSNLTLELKGDWKGADTFRGQRLLGTMRSGDRAVRVAMIALIASGVLVTITAIGAEDDAAVGALADAVARTTTRPAPTP